jgi:hypothetical protein
MQSICKHIAKFAQATEQKLKTLLYEAFKLRDTVES